jgi:hypothetical protein
VVVERGLGEERTQHGAPAFSSLQAPYGSAPRLPRTRTSSFSGVTSFATEIGVRLIDDHHHRTARNCPSEGLS